MITLISSIAVFLLVILIHEFGHFIIAKKVGIKVNEFSIGMGPSIFSKESGETKYSLRALPLGGYVAMEGEDEESYDPRSFNNASVGKRLAVILAGAIMNFILALVILFIIGLFRGNQTNVVGNILENSPAYKSDLKIGDKIIGINDTEIKTYEELINEISKHKNEEIKLTVERENNKAEISIETTEEGKIGVLGKSEVNVLKAIEFSFTVFITMIGAMFGFFKQLFAGGVSFNDLSGPVGIVGQIGTAAKEGILHLAMFLSLININVGFFNLLPIPALDGSKAIILLIEGIRKKPIPKKLEYGINIAGFVLLITLMLIVTYKDILKLFN